MQYCTDVTLNVTFLEKSPFLKHFCGTARFSDRNKEFESRFLKIIIEWNEQNISLELEFILRALEHKLKMCSDAPVLVVEKPLEGNILEARRQKGGPCHSAGENFLFHLFILPFNTQCIPDSLNILIHLTCIKNPEVGTIIISILHMKALNEGHGKTCSRSKG